MAALLLVIAPQATTGPFLTRGGTLHQIGSR